MDLLNRARCDFEDEVAIEGLKLLCEAVTVQQPEKYSDLLKLCDVGLEWLATLQDREHFGNSVTRALNNVIDNLRILHRSHHVPYILRRCVSRIDDKSAMLFGHLGTPDPKSLQSGFHNQFSRKMSLWAFKGASRTGILQRLFLPPPHGQFFHSAFYDILVISVA